jgi:hypothetical protein
MEIAQMKRILFVAVVLPLLLSACGAAATPTTDPALIQASAVAAANTMVALTQAAVPTETAVPPTPLPSPTPLPPPTLLALPTLQLLASPTISIAPIGATAAGDNCQSPLVPNPDGPTTSVRIVNATKGSVILSLYLQKTSFGECGYRSFNLAANNSTTADLPKGCYSAGAFVTEPKKEYKAFGSGCFLQDGKATVTVQSDGSIRLAQ